MQTSFSQQSLCQEIIQSQIDNNPDEILNKLQMLFDNFYEWHMNLIQMEQHIQNQSQIDNETSFEKTNCQKNINQLNQKINDVAVQQSLARIEIANLNKVIENNQQKLDKLLQNQKQDKEISQEIEQKMIFHQQQQKFHEEQYLELQQQSNNQNTQFSLNKLAQNNQEKKHQQNLMKQASMSQTLNLDEQSLQENSNVDIQQYFTFQSQKEQQEQQLEIQLKQRQKVILKQLEQTHKNFQKIQKLENNLIKQKQENEQKEKNLEENIRTYKYSKKEFQNILLKQQISYDEILDIKEKELIFIEKEVQEKSQLLSLNKENINYQSNKSYEFRDSLFGSIQQEKTFHQFEDPKNISKLDTLNKSLKKKKYFDQNS